MTSSRFLAEVLKLIVAPQHENSQQCGLQPHLFISVPVDVKLQLKDSLGCPCYRARQNPFSGVVSSLVDTVVDTVAHGLPRHGSVRCHRSSGSTCSLSLLVRGLAYPVTEMSPATCGATLSTVAASNRCGEACCDCG